MQLKLRNCLLSCGSPVRIGLDALSFRTKEIEAAFCQKERLTELGNRDFLPPLQRGSDVAAGSPWPQPALDRREISQLSFQFLPRAESIPRIANEGRAEGWEAVGFSIRESSRGQYWLSSCIDW